MTAPNPSPVHSRAGLALRDAYRASRLTLAELARRTDVPAARLHGLLTGWHDDFDLGEFERIALALGIDPQSMLVDLFGGEPDPRDTRHLRAVD